MSRTVRGSKPPGYDYWSKRANGKAAFQELGKYGKRRTMHIERQVAKHELKSRD